MRFLHSCPVPTVDSGCSGVHGRSAARGTLLQDGVRTGGADRLHDEQGPAHSGDLHDGAGCNLTSRKTIQQDCSENSSKVGEVCVCVCDGECSLGRYENARDLLHNRKASLLKIISAAAAAAATPPPSTTTKSKSVKKNKIVHVSHCLAPPSVIA